MYKSMVLYMGIVTGVFAQNTSKFIEIRHADRFTFDQQQSDAKYLTGSVVFEHDGAVLTCDTALFFEVDERIQASGNIRITKGDSVSATSNQLEYFGKTRMARMISKVKLIENKLRLETDTLDFNLKSGKAYYTHSALSHYLDNSFISKQGFYNSRLKKLEFLNEVILKNVDYTIRTDTLHYYLKSETAYFLSPSILEQKSDFIYCSRGWYNTKTNTAKLYSGPVIHSENRILKSDSLYYNGIKKTAQAFGHIQLQDTLHKLFVMGQSGIMNNISKQSKIYGKTLAYSYKNNDTLKLWSDTLKAWHHSDNFRFKAWPDVRMAQLQFQARSDSLIYIESDSLMQAFGKPIFWNSNMQLSSKFMNFVFYKNHIYRGYCKGEVSVVEPADSTDALKLNQITGSNLFMLFVDDTLSKLTVNGKAQSLNWMREAEAWKGAETIQSEEYRIWLQQGQVIRVTARPKTQGRIIPLMECNPENTILKNSKWQGHLRPKFR